MRIAITGSTGLIGQALIEAFNNNHEITQIVRDSKYKNDDCQISIWNPAENEADLTAFENQDVIINLCGSSIAVRWTKAQKRLISESRITPTTFLSEIITNLKKPPGLLLSASAIGYYGNHPPDKNLAEQSEVGNGFLADICQQWENATQQVKVTGVRVIYLRFGIVLSPDGGTLAKLLPIFKMGTGGKIGDGSQMMSWISIEDIPPIIEHIIENEHIKEAVNLVSPNPVSNEEFTKILAEILNRPAIFNVKPSMIRLMFGEMADELLLNGAKVLPEVLLDSGYQFKQTDLKEAIRLLLR